MAELFLARTVGPSGFEKLVVLKKILPKFAGSARFVQQFLEEAKLAASLDHPNIAAAHDIGTVDGVYFFTMEYVHGQDVRSILHRTWKRGEQVPIEHAVQIARAVAGGLQHAHELRRPDGTSLEIVHRDVSPSNVLVSYDGAVKLVDFGVAKQAQSTYKTRTGALKGKISYMSPEQARGATLDRRSDLFSLGIVLWELVTTQRLFRGENDLATLQMIINRPAPSVRDHRPECPAELERITAKALAVDPGARYQTAQALLSDLEELAREEKLPQSPSALGAMMSKLFAEELASWREARAQGVHWATHVAAVEAGDLTTPVSESDFIDPLEDIDGDADDSLDDDEVDDDATLLGKPVSARGSRPGSKDDEGETPLHPLLPMPQVHDELTATAPPITRSLRVSNTGSMTVPIGEDQLITDSMLTPVEPVKKIDRDTPPPWPVPAVEGTAPPPMGVPFAPALGSQPLAPVRDVAPRWVVELPPIDPARVERIYRALKWIAPGVLVLFLIIALIAHAASSDDATAPPSPDDVPTTVVAPVTPGPKPAPPPAVAAPPAPAPAPAPTPVTPPNEAATAGTPVPTAPPPATSHHHHHAEAPPTTPAPPVSTTPAPAQPPRHHYNPNAALPP
jgi:serine/threonine protein kinase